MKKLITLLLVLTGCVCTVNAKTKRVFFEIQKDSWRNNSAGIMIHIWDAGSDANTTWESIPYLNRLGSSNWYYYDVNSESTTAKIQIVTNSDKSWKKPNDGASIDFSKNNVVYFGSDESVTVSTFTGYVVANSSRDKLADLTQDGLSLTGTLDFTSAGSDVNFAVFPTFTANDGGYEKYVWDVALRPKTSGDFSLSNLQIYTDDIEYQGNGKTWKEQIRMKYDLTINMSTSKFTLTPYFERSISALKYTTFSSTYDVAIPAGITAKYATSVTGNTIDLADFSGGIPANAGALLYADVNESTSFKFYPPASAPSAATGNIFIPGDGTKITQTVGSGSEKKTNYILTNNTVNGTDQTLKFYLVNSGSGGNIVPVGKAYLQVPTPEGSAPEFFNFNFDFSTPTGISASLNKNEEIKDNKIFNLAGQRVMNPTKGLYIVNGRKVVLK